MANRDIARRNEKVADGRELKSKTLAAHAMSHTIYDLYGEIWGEGCPEFDEALRGSLNPRGSETLYALFGKLGVAPGDRVLDLGCRDASVAIELVRRFGCRVLAIDPIPVHMEWAARCIAEAGMQNQIMVRPGAIEAIPAEDSSIDYVWSRDMLNHVDLPQGLPECARVLRPGGKMFVYMTFASGLCEPEEARRIYAAQAIVPENMSQAYFEQVAQRSGLRILYRDVIGSEWREEALEHETDGKWLVENFLRLSRLQRNEAELVRRFGRVRYEVAYTGDLWGIYILLGKLLPTVYALEKPELAEA